MGRSGAALRASSALLFGQAARLNDVFEAALRARSPRLAVVAVRFEARCGRSVAEALIATLSAGPAADLAPIDGLFGDCRAEPGVAASFGQALIAALATVLGPGFDETARDTWTEAYVDLAERLMAARRNRMDLVA